MWVTKADSITVGLFYMYRKRVSNKLRTYRWHGMLLLLLSCVLILVTGGVSLLVLYWRVMRIAIVAPNSIENASCIIVPGMCLQDEQLGAEYRMRLDRALHLIAYGKVHKHPVTAILLLGGVTEGGIRAESEVAADYLQKANIEPTQCWLEKHSTNTLENFHHAKVLLDEDNIESAVLVSSRYHLARCSVFASAYNIQHSLCAADEAFVYSLKNLYRVLKEAFNLHWYYCRTLFSVNKA